MITLSIESSKDSFDVFQILQGIPLQHRRTLVLEVTDLDQEIDLPVTHEGNTLGHLGHGFPIIT